MDDRELLMLAAKAYWASEIDDVVSIEWSEADNGVLYTHADNQDHNGLDRTYVWNPREDDAAVLQLAVKLQLSISIGLNALGQMVVCVRLPESSDTIVEELGDDACAATRLAVTRAAAEIGKTL